LTTLPTPSPQLTTPPASSTQVTTSPIPPMIILQHKIVVDDRETKNISLLVLQGNGRMANLGYLRNFINGILH
jgi:hypothetical protein